MALTSELRNLQSPLNLFLRKHFPNTRIVTAASRKRMANVETWRPAAPVPWSLIGTAFDYRLRLYFPWQGHARLVAYYGAQTACSEISAPLLQDHGVKKDNIDTPARRLDRKVAKNFLLLCNISFVGFSPNDDVWIKRMRMHYSGIALFWPPSTYFVNEMTSTRFC
jgi:hypothetical protein